VARLRALDVRAAEVTRDANWCLKWWLLVTLRCWQLQQLAGPAILEGYQPVVSAPQAAGNPTVISYNGQRHVCYRDIDANIQDCWYG
jgi:hypothetical protein